LVNFDETFPEYEEISTECSGYEKHDFLEISRLAKI
jgi:hypothetical protein